MKLVDILAREMKVWPTRVEGCDSITQDDDGFMNATITGKTPSLLGGTWISSASSFFNHPNGRGEDYWTEVADDFATAIITREQWQAAVDALNGPVWPDEGALPPVGTVCELRSNQGGWGKAEIKYQGRNVCVWLWVGEGVSPDQVEWSESPQSIEFRQIRTSEQIEADERLAAVTAMLEIDPYLPNTQLGMMSRADFCRALYDAGYRKQATK